MRFESDRRAARLEECWEAERQRREESSIVLSSNIHLPTKHIKNDSVQGVVVEVRQMDSEDESDA